MMSVNLLIHRNFARRLVLPARRFQPKAMLAGCRKKGAVIAIEAHRWARSAKRRRDQSPRRRTNYNKCCYVAQHDN